MFYGLVVNSPEVVKGDYEVVQAEFGLSLLVGLRRGWLMYCGRNDKDLRAMRRTDIEGRVVMFDRGELDFTIIAAVVQSMAALALIVVNNVHGPATKMCADEDDPVTGELQFPCYMISKADGMNLRKVLEREPVDVSLVTEMADMYAWGNGNNGQLGLPGERADRTFMTPQMVVRHQSIRAIACGGNHSVCLLDSGDVFTWGNSEFGALGHGTLVDHSSQPRKIETFPEAQEIVAIASGYFHTLAATKVGDTFAWGWNDFGQLGLGTRDSQAIPMLLERMRNKKVRAITAGYFHSLCLCVNYRKPPKPTKEEMKREMQAEMMASRASRMSKKSMADSKKAAMKRRGSLGKVVRKSKDTGGSSMRSAGGSKKSKKGKKSRQSGSMSMDLKDWRPKDYQPRPEDEVRAVYSWGDGEHGQLGHRDSYTRDAIAASIKSMPSVKAQTVMRNYTALTTPRIIDGLVGMRIATISAGGTHSACTTNKGELLTFGCGLFGRLGHGAHNIEEEVTDERGMLVKKITEMKGEENRNVPEIVPALVGHRIIAVSCGQYHTCAVSDRGDVFTWGKGEMGQLGQGEANMDSCIEPRRIGVLGKRGVCRATCGNSSTYVCTERGTVYVWGYNQGGRLGLGSLGDEWVEKGDKVSQPVHMNTLDGAEVRQICCGDAHVITLTDYYHSDQVPERIDVGGSALAEDHIYKPPLSGCCVVQ